MTLKAKNTEINFHGRKSIQAMDRLRPWPQWGMGKEEGQGKEE